MCSKFNLIVLCTVVLFSVSMNYAQVPQLINFQATLSSPEGVPVNATRTIIFNIYNEAEGGISLWSETQSIVVTNGRFHTLLGSVIPIPVKVFNGTNKYLSLKIEDDPEMAPRLICEEPQF